MISASAIQYEVAAMLLEGLEISSSIKTTTYRAIVKKKDEKYYIAINRGNGVIEPQAIVFLDRDKVYIS